MKFTLDWLRDFVDLPPGDPAEIAEALENLGHEDEPFNACELMAIRVELGIP